MPSVRAATSKTAPWRLVSAHVMGLEGLTLILLLLPSCHSMSAL